MIYDNFISEMMNSHEYTLYSNCIRYKLLNYSLSSTPRLKHIGSVQQYNINITVLHVNCCNRKKNV